MSDYRGTWRGNEINTEICKHVTMAGSIPGQNRTQTIKAEGVKNEDGEEKMYFCFARCTVACFKVSVYMNYECIIAL